MSNVGGETDDRERGPDEKYCSNCGAVVHEKAELCPECGVRIGPSPSSEKSTKSPGLAAIASFFIPGLGQMYNGQIGKGLIIMIFYFVMFGVFFSSPIIGGILIFLVWIGSIFDAYKQAQKYNQGEDMDF